MPSMKMDNRLLTHAEAENMTLHGESWSVGWDIPTRWAVDKDKQCWMNDAHGGFLLTVTADRLLGELHGNNDRREEEVRKFLGRKPRLPEWAAEALRAGWTAPPGFNINDYER